MPWICPECGFKNNDGVRLCVCGYHAEELDNLPPSGWESPDALKGNEQALEEPPTIIDASISVPKQKPKNIKVKLSEKSVEKPAAPERGKPDDEITIKEMESWKFSYSPKDQCIYVGTPALHPFRLTLTMDDLEGLLEIMYQQSGSGKSLTPPQLSGNEILEIVENIDTIVEAKKSKIKLHFSADELKNIADIINKKLCT